MPASKLLMVLLEDRFPDRRIPWGALPTLARRLGISKQRAHQIAEREGYRVMPLEPPPRYCYRCGCGAPVKRFGDCNECLYVTIPCEFCAKPVRRRVKTLVQQVNRQRGIPYSGRVFCNSDCFCQWLWRHSRDVRTSRANSAEIEAALLEETVGGGVPLGTIGRIANKTGDNRRAVSRRGATLSTELLGQGQPPEGREVPAGDFIIGEGEPTEPVLNGEDDFLIGAKCEPSQP